MDTNRGCRFNSASFFCWCARLLFASAAALVMTGCGGGDGGGKDSGGSGPPPVTAPSGLSYTSPVEAVVGTALATLSPQVTGSVSSYSVTPPLPAGLSLATTTGAISGTPTAASPQATYAISATNAGGTTKFDWVLTVKAAAPSNLSYASPVEASVGTPIANLTPTVTGTVDSYTVSPALPAGLTLDGATGLISGTPTQPTAQATYTVRASNGTGSTTFDLVITVTGAAVTAVGVFSDSLVAGLSYVSGGQSGVTNTKGEFIYEVGNSVSFSVGSVSIGTTQGKPVVTPVDLVPNGTSASQEVLNIVSFLVMLDKDGAAENGIQISDAVRAAASQWPTIDFGTTDLAAALVGIISSAQAADSGSHVLPTPGSAQRHLMDSYACLHSGLYLGTASWTEPNTGSSPIAVIAHPSSYAGIGWWRYNAISGTVDFMSGGDPGYSESLDGSFVSELDFGLPQKMSISGAWSDLNNGAGIWHSIPANDGSPDGGTFEVSRTYQSETPMQRFLGAATLPSDGRAQVLLEFDLNFTSGGIAKVTGSFYDVRTDQLLSIEGNVSGETFTATAGDASDITGQYLSDGLNQQITGSLTFDGHTYSVYANGCWLHR